MLLAAAARVVDRDRLRALHVDHDLQSGSADWARHCAEVCAALDVPFDSIRVRVDLAAGIGLEAAARAARYSALGARLRPGEILLTGHHADDQLETLLLRLFRGSGVRGMRGILPAGVLGAGGVRRPLLEFTRAELRALAELWALEWLEDPSNRSVDFDRNLLRTKVLPTVRERWGDAAAHAANRLALAMRDAEALQEHVAADDLAAAGAVPGRLPLAPLRRLDEARQRNALRYAVRDAGLPVPDAARLEALRAGIGPTPAEAARRVEWRGGEARVFRDQYYFLPGRAAQCVSGRLGGFEPLRGGPTGADGSGARQARGRMTTSNRVSAEAPWEGEEGRLALEPIEAADLGEQSLGVPESWAREGLEVRFRAGGERFKPAGDAHHRTLKAWFQQRGIVPWMRGRIPLLYREGRLVAVADLVLADEACLARPDERRWRVRWLDRPHLLD